MELDNLSGIFHVHCYLIGFGGLSRRRWQNFAETKMVMELPNVETKMSNIGLDIWGSNASNFCSNCIILAFLLQGVCSHLYWRVLKDAVK